MTAIAIAERGVRTAVLRAADAPAPTLVVEGTSLGPGFSREAARQLLLDARPALLAAHAGAPGAGVKNCVVARVGPDHLRIEFFQGVEGGPLMTASPEVCVNSMGCAATAAGGWGWSSGSEVLIDMGGSRFVLTPSISRTLQPSWLVTTTLDPAVPIAHTVVVLDGGPFSVTAVAEPIRYVLVAVDPDRAERLDRELEEVRVEVARLLSWPVHDAEPKLGCVGEPTAAGSGALPFRVRQSCSQGWHRGMAGSAMLVLAAAAAVADTVVRRALGQEPDGPVRAATPAGVRQVLLSLRPGPPKVTYALSDITWLSDPRAEQAAPAAQAARVAP